METVILINVRDRPTEIALLLQSLRTQTYSDFDIYILDDCSGTPLTNYHFFNCVMNRLKIEGHKVFMKKTEFTHGVSRARHAIAEWALEKNYKYFLRVDDDVVLEPDYLERLHKVLLDFPYDIASGVTVPMQVIPFKRNPRFLNGIVNRVILDKGGAYIMNGDDCGMEYTATGVTNILPAHHFRSCALIKREVHEQVKYYPTKLSHHGFREEQIFSYRALMKGFKIGIDLNAINYHQMTPSGGERPTANMVPFNQEILEEFTKENKEELSKLFPTEPMPSKQALMKESNLK